MTERLRIERREDGRLMAGVDGDEMIVVRASRCFPWSERDRHISLRNDEDEEIAHIVNLDDLEPSARRAVQTGLAESAFVFEIVGVESIREEFEIRNWKARTRQGAITFQTKLDDWPRTTPEGGMLISDVAGNLYHVADPHALDDETRKKLWAFID